MKTPAKTLIKTIATAFTVARRESALAVGLALCMLASGLSASDHNHRSRIITFDAPSAGTGTGKGTLPNSINPEGTITGYCADASNLFHGFLRGPDGAITTFDAPGAGTSSGQGTFPVAVSPAEAITGYYVDASNVGHGFLRDGDGTFTTFDGSRCGQRRRPRHLRL
jgi:hypothetical protein